MQSEPTPTKTIRIMIVDDHPVISQGLKQILEKDERLQGVGLAKDLASLLHTYSTLSPDVVLMDVAMPQADGITATQVLLEQHPDATVLMLTSHDDDETIVAALDAGARGFLMKKAEVNEIINAIIATSNGKRSISPEALEALIRAKTTAKHPDDELTERELEVLRLMATGLTNPQIADRLHLTVSTVKFHIGLIFKKLEVSTRTEAVTKAIQNKLVSPE